MSSRRSVSTRGEWVDCLEYCVFRGVGVGTQDPVLRSRCSHGIEQLKCLYLARTIEYMVSNNFKTRGILQREISKGAWVPSIVYHLDTN